MPVAPGETFLLPKPGHNVEHLWIVLTEPDDSNPSRVAIVNVTTRRAGSDTTVVLAPGDHPFIDHESVVFYRDTTLAPAHKLIQAVSIGVATRHADLEADLLRVICEGLLQSPFTEPRIKEYCRERFPF